MLINYTQATDLILVDSFRNGDENAAAELVSRYKDRVYTSILFLVKDAYVADDIFQETFLKMFTQILKSKYCEQGKFLGWAQRIAHNLCIDHFRRIKKDVRIVTQDGTDLLELIGEGHKAHDSYIERCEVQKSIRTMITHLPRTQREVVSLRIYGELSFKEIAEITGVSVNTALGRMRYALNNLRKMIEENKLVLR